MTVIPPLRGQGWPVRIINSVLAGGRGFRRPGEARSSGAWRLPASPRVRPVTSGSLARGVGHAAGGGQAEGEGCLEGAVVFRDPGEAAGDGGGLGGWQIGGVGIQEFAGQDVIGGYGLQQEGDGLVVVGWVGPQKDRYPVSCIWIPCVCRLQQDQAVGAVAGDETCSSGDSHTLHGPRCDCGALSPSCCAR